MLSRTSFRFSAHGTHVACLAGTRQDRWHAESWELPDGDPHVHGGLTVHGPASQVLPLDDGGVLLCQPLPGDTRGHELTRSDPRLGVRPLATVATLGFRVVEHPGADALAVAVTTDTEPELTSTVWLVRDTMPTLQQVCTMPGLLAGGSWLDGQGTRLGLNQAHQGTLTAVVLDLDTGTVTPAFPGQPNVRLLLALPQTDLLVVGDESGALGWSEHGGSVTWSRALDGHLNTFPVAAEPDGERVVLRYENGALSGLVTYRPRTDEVVDLGLPPGSVGATGSWVGDTLRVPFASPERQAGLVAVRPDAAVTVERPAGTRTRTTPRLDSFPGPAGPVDAVLYGDWRSAPRVVVALHGGPDSSWRLEHDPVLAQLAGTDTAVVAVNPRGSRGYRGAHEALRDGWGGADLADVHAVGTTIARERGAAVELFGVSYGAFLALLALGTRPDPWTRAAVVAPFLSGPRLYADAGPRVRALVDRLGGRNVYADELGPRDVVQLAGRISAPLLVVHGARDDVVPVEHGRELDARLRAAEAPVTYLELADAGHDPFTGPDAETVTTRIRDFLAGAPTGEIEHHHGPRGGQQLARVRR